MSFEAEPQPQQPNHEELKNRLMTEYADAQVEMHGRTMALSSFVQLRDALCPYKPDQVDHAEDVAYLANVLADSKVELTEDYQSYLKVPAETTNEAAARPAPKETKVATAEASVAKAKNTETEELSTAGTPAKRPQPERVIDAVPSAEAVEMANLTPTIPAAHKEVFERVVQLEELSADSEPVVETQAVAVQQTAEVADIATEPTSIVMTVEALPHQAVREESLLTDTVAVADVETMASEADQVEPTMQSELGESLAPVYETGAAEAEPMNLDLLDVISEAPLNETTSEADVAETETLEIGETVLLSSEATDLLAEPAVTEIMGLVAYQTESAEQTNPADHSEQLEPVAFPEVIDQVEKTPAVIVAEFLVQALPAEAVTVYERMQTIEPEAAAEVAAQVEMIVVVSDRLHDLVEQGDAGGEEGQQIVAYLKREYEVLLRAIGVEPTEELIDDYIAYIFSQNYQTKADADFYELTERDDGMHEIKLFDEQSVFAKAQQATVRLGSRLGSSLGRLAVTYDGS